MKIILFSKELRDLDVTQMIRKARAWRIDGYDLAVRPGYAVNPDNAGTALPEAVSRFHSEGLVVPLITARWDLIDPGDPDVRPLLAAMDKADVRLLKLGYVKRIWDPAFRYWPEVDRVRACFEKWAALGREYGVCVLYHTHSSDAGDNEYLGSNASNLMHLIRDLDPAAFGAYLDPGHLSCEGERFPYAVSIVGEYLKAVALKDVRTERDPEHGRPRKRWVPAGEGQVDWPRVFSTLSAIGYDGPISVHAEYEHADAADFFDHLPAEIAFFKAWRAGGSG